MHDLAKIAGVAALVGGTFAYDAYDKAVNYHEVTARVSLVKSECYLTKRLGKHKSAVTDTMPCHAAEQTARHHPDYKGYKVRYTFDVQLLYAVPGDKRTRRGTLSVVGRKWLGLTTGDVLNVLVDKRDSNALRQA